MRKHILLILFLCLHCVARGQTGYDYRYWFDGQIASGQQGMSASPAWDMQIDVSALSDGLHVLHYQVTVSDTLYSPVHTAFFMKNPVGHDSYTCFCYINDTLWHQQEVSTDGGLMDWNLDVSPLSADRLHSMLVMVKTPTGEVTSTKQAFFWRAKTAAELKDMTCFYSLDGGKTLVEGGVFQDKGFSFDVDIQTLNEGLHQLLCLLVDEHGVVVRTCSYNFIKQHDTYVRYDYWVNDDVANLRTVEARPVKPYHFIDMLEVGSYPLRSADFHFEVEDDVPYVYAKNDLHVRFYNSRGDYAEESCAYIDAASKQKVETRGVLQSGTACTDAAPATNAIHWYQVNTLQGDSLVFRVNRNASLKVFSPTGMKLLEAEGEEVSEASCVVTENGICYVALHDVEGVAGEVTIELNTLKSATDIDTVVTESLVDVYTLQGIRIRSRIPVQHIMRELPRGIYIVGGKKILVK